MTRLGKFVAAMIALVLFGTPLLALANCSPKLATAGHCGGENCPMIIEARQPGSMQMSGTTSRDGSCCQVKDLPSPPRTPATAPGSGTIIHAPAGQLACAAPALPPCDNSASAIAPPAGQESPPSSQALLCTFIV